jgi:Cu2+-exporting ATPase
MTAAQHPSACPACDAVPLAEALAGGKGGEEGRMVLSVPAAHCAVCINTVEHALEAVPGVRSARMNLTLKRVSVETDPGLSPDLLTRALSAVGYEAQELDGTMLSTTETDRQSRDFLMRLGVAGFAMMNVMILSVAVWSGASDVTRDMFHWVSGAIALPAVAFSAQPFFISAWRSLRVRRLNMDVPISLGIILASLMSLVETALHGQEAYFDAALSLTFFLLAGRYLDQRTRVAARSAAEALSALEVPRAQRPGGEIVAVSDLKAGELVRVLPGGRMPVDGVVRDGETEIDRGLLTGETLPVRVAPGDAVSAGEVNLTGPLTVEITAAGRDTRLHRMADLVAMAETARNRYTSIADRAARIYAPLVHVLALSAFVAWFAATHDLRFSVNIAVALLIITCPCALGLAVPAVSTAASGRLFRRGLLIKSPTALERLAEVDLVVFDKTGTLTEGRPELAGDLAGSAEDRVALALAQASMHPLAVALAAAGQAAGLTPATLEDVREVPGHGVEALHGGARVRLGRADWVGALPEAGTATYLGIGGATRAYRFTDHPRAGAEQAVVGLKALGLEVELLSGDVPSAVGEMAARLGIPSWAADLRPEEKAARIEALRVAGHRVLMVGDGLNDTIALAQAHVSISPASALDAARVVADIVALGGSLEHLPEAVRTARRAKARILENFALAAAYNIVAVPFALAGLASPLLAALAMSSSSIIVSLNALRLR